MKIFLKYVLNTVGFISGIITIVTLFIKPEIIGGFLYQNIKWPLILNLAVNYSKFIVLVPLITGIYYSSRYGGFSFPRVLNPIHLLSSFIMFEFWIGVGNGIKYIGYYLVMPLAGLFFLKAIL